MRFSDRLRQLPPVQHLAAVQLLGADGTPIATIENKPGQAGSLAIYHALGALYGGRVGPGGAALGLEWYGEHTTDAAQNPGQHPNIDRLSAWAQGGETYQIVPVLKST